MIPLARNARTACIAFTALASRYCQGNIKDSDVGQISSEASYNIFSNMNGVQFILPSDIFSQKEKCDDILSKLFKSIIYSVNTTYSTEHIYDPTLAASNFLKQDKNYYKVISIQWSQIKDRIKEILGDIFKG